jgi:UDP-glucose 4-epimerase
VAERSAAPVIVTGAAGFIGRALVARLAADGVPVRAVLRRSADLPSGVEPRIAGELAASTEWP